MHIKSKTISTLILMGISSFMLLPGVALSDGGATYEITITNLTPGTAIYSAGSGNTQQGR